MTSGDTRDNAAAPKSMQAALLQGINTIAATLTSDVETADSIKKLATSFDSLTAASLQQTALMQQMLLTLQVIANAKPAASQPEN
jgi:hypothetical protein